MFSQSELEAIPEKIRVIFKTLENKVFDDICRRISDTDSITRTADYQIQRLNQLKLTYPKELKKMIQEALELSDEEIDELYSDVIKQGYVRDKDLYVKTNTLWIPYEDNEPLLQLVDSIKEQTKETFSNYSNTLGIITDDNKAEELTEYFRNKIDTAITEIGTGVFDYNTSMRSVVNELTNSGIRVVDYETGWHNRIDVATRRAVMTGLNQITNHISEQNAKKLKTDYYEVSYHGTARPEHQVWQGRVYSKDELVSVCGLGEPLGLLGINCYHHYDAFVKGVSERRYSDEWLDEQNAKANELREYNGRKYTLYDATQRQRQLETRIRACNQKIQLLKSYETDGKELLIAQIRYNRLASEYNEFSNKMNLPVQTERLRQDNLLSYGN